MIRWLVSLLLLVLSLLALSYYFSSRPITLGAGIHAPLPPYQAKPIAAQIHQRGQYQLTEVADFVMTAKVLAIESYRFDRGADLSKVDMVFGWGRMSDEKVLQYIDIRQSKRWYYWRASKLLIPKLEIARSSANMHLIAANDTVAQQISKVKQGQVIELSGHLVNVQAEDEFSWQTSMSRYDTGDGACELIWVEAISVVEPR